MTARMSDSPAAQAARDRRDRNQGEATGQAAPEPTGTYAAAQEKAKADRQPRVDQSDQVKTMLASLRKQESGSYEGDYTAQGQWIQSQADKSMGAYGIMSKNWAGYTSAAGIPNANWRDSRSQDRVAGQMVNNLANQYGGNMGLVAAAWFAGAHAMDRVIGKYGYQATTEQIGKELGPTIGDYATQVVGHGAGISTTPYGIEHNLSDFNNDVGFSRPKSRRLTNTTPQDAVRARLVTLAGMSGAELTAPDVGVGGRDGQLSYDELVAAREKEGDGHVGTTTANPLTNQPSSGRVEGTSPDWIRGSSSDVGTTPRQNSYNEIGSWIQDVSLNPGAYTEDEAKEALELIGHGGYQYSGYDGLTDSIASAHKLNPSDYGVSK